MLSRNITMRLVLGASLLSQLLLGHSVVFAEECAPNAVSRVAKGNALAVTEVAINKEFTACPATDIGRLFSFAAGERVYFWFRIEGTAQFAQTAHGRNDFGVRLHQVGGSAENTRRLRLRRSRIDLTSIRQEAALPGNSGYFDWRLFADAGAFSVPGTYLLELTYGGKKICFRQGACALSFSVKRR